MQESNFGAGKILGIVLAIILLFTVAFFATIDGIRGVISDIIHSVLSGLFDNTAETLRRARNLFFFWQYTSPGENDEGVFIYLVNNDDINGTEEDEMGIRTTLINANVEMDRIGLDSTIIKEMDVVFNASKGTTSTLVLAELGKVYKLDSEGNKILGNPEVDILDDEGYVLEDDEILKITDQDAYIEKFKLEDTERADRIIRKYSSENMEEKTKKIGTKNYTLHYFKDDVGVSELFWFQADDQFGAEYDGNYYLGAYGVIHIEDYLGEDMIYRDEHNLELLIEDYERYQGKSREQAVKDAIEKSYGMTDIGTIFVYNWDSLTEHTRYQFKDEEAINSEPEEVLLDEISTQTIELEDLLNYSKFTIPVELTTDLFDLTGSDQFADVFLNYALKNTEIHVRLYKNEDVTTTYLAKQYDIIPSQFFLEIYNFDEEEIFERYSDIVVGRTYDGVEIEVGGIKSIAEQEIGEATEENNAINNDIRTRLNRLRNISNEVYDIVTDPSPDNTTNLFSLIIAEQNNGHIYGNVENCIYSISGIQSRIDNLMNELEENMGVEDCEEAIRILEELEDQVYYQKNAVNNLRSLAQALKNYEDSADADSDLIRWIVREIDRLQNIITYLGYVEGDGVIDVLIGRKQAIYEKYRFGKDLEDALLLENKGNGEGVYTVTETKIDRAVTESFTPIVKSIKAWFAELNYEDPEQIIKYTIKIGGTSLVGEEEYNNYDALDQYICDENLIDGDELDDRGISFDPETVEKKEGFGVSGITDNKLWYHRYESVDPKNKNNYEFLTIKNLAEEVAVTGEAYDPSYNGSSTKTDYVYSKFDKENKRAYDGERTRTEYYEAGTLIAQTPEERDARVKAFLALLKNSEGTIAGHVNGFDSEGIVVEYLDVYDTKGKVGDLLENGAEMLFQLLESSESTEGLADVFRYIMYLYTGRDYGVTDLDFFAINATFSGRSAVYSIGINVKTDDPNTSLPVLTEAELRSLIERCFSGSAKDNLLTALPGLIQGQNTYKVNAIFSIAVAQQESQCGTAWDAIDPSTYNMYSIKGGSGWNSYTDFSDAALSFARLISGSNYFGAGRVTVTAIQPVYCPSPPGWAEAVTEHIRRMCDTCGYEITLVSGSTVENANEMVEAALTDIGKTGSQMSSKISFSGEWCCAFVSYYYDQYGFIPSVLNERYYSCTSLMNYAKSRGFFFKEGSGYIPQTGDLVLYNWKANRNSDCDHVGMVVSNNGSTITTVEGNIGNGGSWTSREVGTRERDIWWPYIVGYVSLSVALGGS